MNKKELKKRNAALIRLLKAISIDFLLTAEGKELPGLPANEMALIYIERIKKLDEESEDT